ncbi:hypothetical protein [Ruegeria meonggei]|uniref:hypothetical protein n=1 Tax=Ruegeria meonggei TaxID=1446476 RepID=UPI003673089A
MSHNYIHNSYTSSNSPWRVEKQALHRVFSQQLRKLVVGRAEGKRRHILQRDFFRHPGVRQAAILKATKGKIGREQAYSLARQVNPYAEQKHAVTTYPITKTSGGKRNICIMPPVLSAMHKIIKCALDAEFVRHPLLFGVKHYGRDQAAVQIQQLQREGYGNLWQTDIEDCLDSFNLDALYELPLPNQIIANALDTRNHNFSFQAHISKQEAKKGASPETPDWASPENYMVRDHSPIGSLTDDIVCNTRGPAGLMQGSPASSAILAWHLNAVLNDLPCIDDVRVIVCFDNLLVASRSEEGSRTIRDTLADSLGRCPFGPLTLHPPTSADPDHGIEFLGYNHPSDGSTIGVGQKARERLMRHLNTLEQKFDSGKFSDPELETFAMWCTLLDFASGYSSTTDIVAEMADFVTTSSWIPATSNNPVLMHMHCRLFSQWNPFEETFFKTVRNMRRRHKRD